jgi:uncharacterized protein (TIGR04255 family)
MRRHETFPNAPIEEALFDIGVLPAREDLLALDDFSRRVVIEFPERRLRQKLVEGAAAKADIKTEAHIVKDVGYSYHHSVTNKILQARLDGFSFSTLRPYKDWDTTLADFLKYFDLYFDSLRPKTVSRVGVRYINRIFLPLPMSSFEDYFELWIKIPDTLPQSIIDLFSRVVIPFPEQGCISVVTCAIEKPDSDRRALPCIFDIDCYKNVGCDPTKDNIMKEMNILRNVKNEIFLTF